MMERFRLSALIAFALASCNHPQRTTKVSDKIADWELWTVNHDMECPTHPHGPKCDETAQLIGRLG